MTAATPRTVEQYLDLLRIELQGADPATMPVETQKDLTLYVNEAAAQRMGITLPADLVADAEVVG